MNPMSLRWFGREGSESGSFAALATRSPKALRAARVSDEWRGEAALDCGSECNEATAFPLPYPSSILIHPYMKETDWHHAPLHRFVPNAVHMITASTLRKQHLFSNTKKLSFLQDTLLNGFQEFGWDLHAWACLSNHYHVIAKAPEEGSLSTTLQTLHSRISSGLNDLDHMPGRQVMYQYWDRCISYDSSYYARMHYVIHNPVKHGLVENAKQYPYCSAAWLEQKCPKSFCRRVKSYKYDKVNEPDEFEVVWEG